MTFASIKYRPSGSCSAMNSSSNSLISKGFSNINIIPEVWHRIVAAPFVSAYKCSGRLMKRSSSSFLYAGKCISGLRNAAKRFRGGPTSIGIFGFTSHCQTHVISSTSAKRKTIFRFIISSFSVVGFTIAPDRTQVKETPHA